MLLPVPPSVSAELVLLSALVAPMTVPATMVLDVVAISVPPDTVFCDDSSIVDIPVTLLLFDPISVAPAERLLLLPNAIIDPSARFWMVFELPPMIITGVFPARTSPIVFRFPASM